MTNQEILSEISSLPDEAKKQVVSLISSLKKSYRKTGLDSNLSGKQVSKIWYDYTESSGNYISSINSSTCSIVNCGFSVDIARLRVVNPAANSSR